MKRAPVHLTKSVLSKGTRSRLPASDFVFAAERRFPIPDLYHGRLALIYVMSPSLSADRDTVVRSVLARYPELRSFWESRFTKRRARPARPATVSARRRERRITNPSSEDNMPIYVVNPLAYDETDVVMVGKPRHRLIRARTSGKPGRRSERLTLPSSELHALNPKTGAAFCGAGRNRKGVVVGDKLHKADKKLVTCMRCIKILKLNDVDRTVPGIERRLAITERMLKPSSAKKREKHLMIKGGDQGRHVSGSGHFISSHKPYRIFKERTAATGGPMFRGTEDIKDFEKYVGWMGKPTQTIGEKRSAILAARKAAAEAARTAEGRRRRAESGFEETLSMMGEFSPMGFEEMETLRTSAEMSRRGRLGAAAAAKSRAEGVAADAARRAAAKTPYTLLAGEEFRDNPRRGRKSSRAQKAGLAKGQSLMQQAAAAYRAGKYASMQDALRGVARKRNPLSEDGMIVNGVAAYRKMKKPAKKSVKAKGPSASDRARFESILERVREQNRKKAMSKAAAAKRASARVSYAAEEYMDNPRRKGSKAAKSAQGNAAKAMSLYRSGRADSLAEAWAMVKRRA
jgi:hypothetical protein